MPDGPRYEDDFFAWTQHQAEVLQTMPVSDDRSDLEHAAGEIEDLGKSERDVVRSQIRRIIEHLLKLSHSPAEQPRFDWVETIDDGREALSDKLAATLRRDAQASLDKLYLEGRRRAARGLRSHGEPVTADALPQAGPYSLDDICRKDWYSDPPGEKP